VRVRQPCGDEQSHFSLAEQRIDLGVAARLHADVVAEAFEHDLDDADGDFVEGKVDMTHHHVARLRMGHGSAKGQRGQHGTEFSSCYIHFFDIRQEVRFGDGDCVAMDGSLPKTFRVDRRQHWP
jgi:hypothetical protein